VFSVKDKWYQRSEKILIFLIQLTGAILQEGEWLFLIEVKWQVSLRRKMVD
jgi:hypothetical protein